jgi:release factor glutamine methyltransferase
VTAPTPNDAAAPAAAAAPARWTVMDVLRWMTSRFSERGSTTPRLDAEVLAAHALGATRVQLYVQYDRPLVAAELDALRELVKRRQGGESVAYITGKKEFWGLELGVDARVLVPRPDTETLVDEALARLGARRAGAGEATEAAGGDGAAAAGDGPPARVVDVGTGSGAIAVALAKSAGKGRAACTVVASDVSPDALAVARANAERHGVAITFVEGDLDAPLGPHAPFDLIAANLPYVPAGEIAGLAPEVRAEPRLALDGGADGLDLVRRLVAAAPALLAPGGAIVLEIGDGQAAATAALLTAAGFTGVRVRRDLGEIDRVVSAVKP